MRKESPDFSVAESGECQKNRKLYQIVCEAEDEETGSEQIVYFCTENPPRFFVRPKHEFFETFQDGIDRFEPIFDLGEDIDFHKEQDNLVFVHGYDE